VLRRLQNFALIVPFGFGCGSVVDVPATETGSTTSGTTEVPSSEGTTGSSSSGDTAESSTSGPALDRCGLPGGLSLPCNGILCACDPWTGDGCKPDEKCTPWDDGGWGFWSGTLCVPLADNPVPPGEPCTVEITPYSGRDDCEARSMCFGVDPETLQGRCVPFCCGYETEPHCEDPCDRCVFGFTDALPLCFPTCDPLAQDCAPGRACTYVEPMLAGREGGSFLCIPSTPPRGSGGLGDPCEPGGCRYGDPFCPGADACAAGSFCAPAELVDGCVEDMAGCCTAFCDYTETTPCPLSSAATECIPWFEEHASDCFEHANVGGCLLVR
jgi:hypothetical protein